ncbi:MAG: 50S ribosomal protein L32 [Oscillospiraceae bacterium]|jgi:large subunit ribosomal protein L32|nr:50S ribosomal protein L32 [Oscillospiraceae bacterium]
MAVPKAKISSARQNKRRSSVWKISAPALMKCPKCGAFKVAHQMCNNCGYYNGRQVIKKDI